MSVKFQTFSETTMIHGIFEIFHNRPNTISRYVWILIFACSLILCTWQSCINIREYNSFKVMTKESFENENKPQFPAITLWNKNFIKRSGLNNGVARYYLILYSNAISAEKNMKKLYAQMYKSCPFDNSSDDNTGQMISDYYFNKKRFLLTTDNILDAFKAAIITKEMNFVKCWVNKIVYNCNRIVLTTSNEFYYESKDLTKYSINLKADLAKNFIDKDNGSMNKDYDKLVLNNMLETAGICEQSIMLLLNVNQREHCTADFNIYYGTGFQVTLHDPRTLPTTELATAFNLSPGYQYNIGLKPTNYNRKTEHLGNCLTLNSLYMFPNNTNYLKEFCQIQCKVELIYKRCNCLVTLLHAAGVAFGTKHGLNESKVGQLLGCLTDMGPTCTIRTYDEIAQVGIEKICPQCKQQCIETKFNYQMTVTKFPPKHLLSYYALELNESNVETLRKNYLLLNVFYESSMVNVNEETQVFTLKDLFIFIGNNLMLFLGMSFMTFGK